MRHHCKVAQRQISVRIWAGGGGGGGGGVHKIWKNYRIRSYKGGGGGGGGSKSGEFGRNSFWMVPSGNYNDITFMNYTCLFNSGFNLLQFAQVNLYTTFGNISLVLVMQYKLRIKRVRVPVGMYACGRKHLCFCHVYLCRYIIFL